MARHAGPQADPAHWAQLDQGSVELVRGARGYLDEITPPLHAAERDRALPAGIIPGLLDVGFVRGAIGVRDGVAERLFRDAREATIGEGTSQMQVLQIGQALPGVSAVR